MKQECFEKLMTPVYSSPIQLLKYVLIHILYIHIFVLLVRAAFVRMNGRAISVMFVHLSVWERRPL